MNASEQRVVDAAIAWRAGLVPKTSTSTHRAAVELSAAVDALITWRVRNPRRKIANHQRENP